MPKKRKKSPDSVVPEERITQLPPAPLPNPVDPFDSDFPNPIFELVKEVEGDETPARDAICQALRQAGNLLQQTANIPTDLEVAIAIMSEDPIFRKHLSPIVSAKKTNAWKAKQMQVFVKNLSGPLASMMLGETIRQGGLFGGIRNWWHNRRGF